MESFDPRIVVLCVVIAFAGVGWLIQWRKRLAAKSWPTATAVIEQTCVKESDGRYQPGLLYSYQVNGEFYSGEHYLAETSHNSDGAMEMAAPWLRRKILVRYRPGHPESSVFLPEDLFFQQSQAARSGPRRQ